MAGLVPTDEQGWHQPCDRGEEPPEQVGLPARAWLALVFAVA